ncbi:hypothetical protein JOM56_008833 [Amanita muscaria]
MSTLEDSEYRFNLRPHRSSSSQPKPKGILKNAPPLPGTSNHSLQWDEENLALTEIQKDSLMKITEPKTPFVRYNAETDTIEGEIPNLDLGRGYVQSPPRTPEPSSPTGADTSGPSSRRTSFSSSGRPSGRSASSSSSRSTSFSLPNDSKKDVTEEGYGGGEEVEIEEMDEETAKKHAEFVKARGRHYSNEAMAMKRARELIQKDDDEMDNNTNNETHGQRHEEHEMDEGEPAEELHGAPGPSMNGI